jgi:hypothetical protein
VKEPILGNSFLDLPEVGRGLGVFRSFLAVTSGAERTLGKDVELHGEILDFMKMFVMAKLQSCQIRR